MLMRAFKSSKLAFVSTAVALSLVAGSVIAGQYVLPFGDSQTGRQLFVNKGCVVCHAINGVGGTVAPPLDASTDNYDVDPYAFMARMWRGADAMLLLQAMELGYQIEFTAEELAHIDRFLNDSEIQREFSEDEIPDLIRDWMIDDVYERL